MNRVSLKVTGAQGQGINSIGEMCLKGLKREGYCVFGYKEYMSLIKGGHSSYQCDVSDELIQSSETHVDILICLNHHGLEENWNQVKSGGMILHQTPMWKFPPDQQAQLDADKISVIYMPNEELLRELNAPPKLGNILITAAVWTVLDRDAEALKGLVTEQFGYKGEKIVAKNIACIDRSIQWVANEDLRSQWDGSLPGAQEHWTSQFVLTGSEAMGLGVIAAGCRVYAGYPMTPSSPLLSFIAEHQNETGMTVKQAEDEITAVQIMAGAMLAGTRAATGTSGGGFDLMTETVSLCGITETPGLIVLAQRPGPGTGLPTWTAQGDLLLAVNAAHGEFARCVISVSDADDAHALMNDAFNIAEQYQTPVIVLTDKQIAEAIYTVDGFGGALSIDRGRLVTDPKELKGLSPEDRYDPEAENGISPRWLPGSEAATYCAQGDEHSPNGSVDESSENAIAQMDKRMRKMAAMRGALPEPLLFRKGSSGMEASEDLSGIDHLIVSWGSNRGVILDCMKDMPKGTAYLHYTYLWPLRTERLSKLFEVVSTTTLVECNNQGQLGMLIKQECGLECDHRILKYDGRPFFSDELSSMLTANR